MKVKVMFFGILAEKSGCSTFVIADAPELNDLIEKLKANFPFLAKATYSVAVNQAVVRGNMKLSNNDEVAFLPPFAGG